MIIKMDRVRQLQFILEDDDVSNPRETEIDLQEVSGSLNYLPLGVLGLSMRSYNALMKQGLVTLGQDTMVIKETDAHAKSPVRNLGKMGVEEVHQRISAYLANPIGTLTPVVIVDSGQPEGEVEESLIPDETTGAEVIRWQNLVQILAAEVALGKLHPLAVLGGQSIFDLIASNSAPIDESRLTNGCDVIEIALNRKTISEELEIKVDLLNQKRMVLMFSLTAFGMTQRLLGLKKEKCPSICLVK